MKPEVTFSSIKEDLNTTMKVLVVAALLVAITAGRPNDSVENQNQQQQKWPWQEGKLYKYEVQSHTLTRLQEGASSGSAVKANFVIRVKSPGLLLAKLEGVQHVQVHQELSNHRELPQDLPYKPYQQLEQLFEITVDGGRIKALNIPSSVSLQNVNLLKGLISSLQVDLTPYRSVHNSHNFYDEEMFQGQFSKNEMDVTGDCETLYTVSPVASEWRRELPRFADQEEPIEITKSKNYGKCSQRVAYHFGIPEGVEWSGNVQNPRNNQLIKRSTDYRILAGKQGPIYKAEVTSAVYVSPHMYGTQKAEVLSYVSLNLLSVEQDNQPEWNMPENMRLIKNLLYSLTTKMVWNDDESSWNSNEDSNENSHEQETLLRRSSLDSEEDDLATYLNDDIKNIMERPYVALYMTPQSKDNKNTPMIIQKLTQEIAQQLQNPNNMPKADVLSKFNIMVRFISSMTSEQLKQASRGIEQAKTSNNIMKADMWMIFRDAVTQAGTIPAYQLIQSWIQSNKVQGEEAAQVVATLPTTLRYPTKDLMMQFFNLAMSDEVMRQSYLNSTALIAATRLINMGQVNNSTAHKYYPTHMYGRLSRKNDRFVLDEILPRLNKELKEAIMNNNSNRGQVVIKAIGNLGHRNILDVFSPYLQGEIKVSTYLRRLMILNMNILAQQNDHHARVVLYSILRNTAEPREVRLAAIDTIFMTIPTTAMMQAMAQMTNEDPDVHVRAVLKSSIETAAQLKNPRYAELAKSAQAVREKITEEDFGTFYSNKQFSDFYDVEDNLDFFSVLNYMSSENDRIPKHMRFSWYNKMQAWNNKNTISSSMSDVRQLMEYFQEKLYIRRNPDNKQSTLNHKYSAEKIAEMLNIQRDLQKPLEASFSIDLMNQQRFLAFSEADMHLLPHVLVEGLEKLRKGIDFHYTKVLNPTRVTVMFPVAMGVPFIFKYREPTLVHLQGNAKAQIQLPSEEKKDYSVNIDKEIQFTFARNIDGSVGFFDTLSEQYASAGVVNKFQLNIPMKVNMQMEYGKVRVHLQPLQPDQDTTIVHYSVWPYTASQNKDTQTTIAQDPTTKVVNRLKKVNSLDTKFGLATTGAQFQIQGYSYSNDLRNIGSMFRNDWFSSIVFAGYQKDVAMTHYNLKYLGKQSQNKGVTLTGVYAKYYNQKNTDKDALKSTNVKDVTPDSNERRHEILYKVSSGINAAKVQLVDLSATFEGSQKSDYVFTAAIANSPVSSKIQYVIFAGRNNPKLGKNQINAVGTVEKSGTYSLNFREALKQEMKTNFNIDIRFNQNENGKINVNGLLERTKNYVEILEKQPLGKKCIEEMEKNNFYQPPCHEMILMAHSPDRLKASVTYKEVSPTFKNMTYNAYRMATHLGFWFTENNVMKSTADGKLEIEADVSYVDRTYSLMVNTRSGDLRVSDAPLPKIASAALANYSPIHPWQRIGNKYSTHQFLPYCTVDGQRIKTFSGRIFDYTVSRAWHVVIQDDAKYAGKYQHSNQQLVVLARRPSEKQQEIYISYRSNTGKDIEINMSPAPEDSGKKAVVEVTTNLKKISEGDLITYWDDSEQIPLLQYYPLSDGVLMLDIDEERYRALYDGQRLVMLTGQNRNNTRGICGYMSGDVRDDYWTPLGIVDSPAHFAASYALNTENSEPQTMELQQLAQKLAYQRQHKQTAILKSYPEWQKRRSSVQSHSSQNVYRVRSYGSQVPCKLESQVQYFETHGEICITTQRLPACSTRCSSEGNQVQPAHVVCRPKSDKAFRMYIDQIRQGQNPEVEGVSQIKQFRVPTQCKA